MTAQQALDKLVDMALRKENIYNNIKDPAQRKALKQEIYSLTCGASALLEISGSWHPDDMLAGLRKRWLK